MFTIPKLLKKGSPVRFLFADLFAENKRRLLLISGLSVLSSGLNAIAYLAIFPLLNLVLGITDWITLGPFTFYPTSSLVWPLMLGIVVLLIFAIQARYRMHKLSLSIHRVSSQKSAETGLVRFRKYLSSNPNFENDPQLLSVFRITIWQVPFACGLVMKRMAIAVTDVIQISIFLTALFLINAYITAAFLALAAAVSIVYSGSLNLVASNAKAAYSRDHLSRGKFKSALLDFAGSTPEQAKQVASSIYSAGPVKEMFERRLDFRKEMQKGPAIVEHVYPVAVILLPSLLLLLGTSESVAGKFLVFILILRHTISLLQSLAGALIVISQQLPLITLYQNIAKSYNFSDLFSRPPFIHGRSPYDF